MSCSMAMVDAAGPRHLDSEVALQTRLSGSCAPPGVGASEGPALPLRRGCAVTLHSAAHTELGCPRLHPVPAGQTGVPPARPCLPGGTGGATPRVPSEKGGNTGLLPEPLPPPRLCLWLPGLLWAPRRGPGCVSVQGRTVLSGGPGAWGSALPPTLGKRSNDAATKGDWLGRAGTSGAQGTAPAGLRPDSSRPHRLVTRLGLLSRLGKRSCRRKTAEASPAVPSS